MNKGLLSEQVLFPKVAFSLEIDLIHQIQIKSGIKRKN